MVLSMARKLQLAAGPINNSGPDSARLHWCKSLQTRGSLRSVCPEGEASKTSEHWTDLHHFPAVSGLAKAQTFGPSSQLT